jgi:uncharacterized membrane protein YccC
LGRFAERETLRPDLGRGVRCTVAFMAPLLLALTGKLPVEVVFAAVAAQGIALVDVRGGYRLRFLLLMAMTGVIAAAAGLGALSGTPLGLALAATALVAAGTGLWRHLSSDYGPSLASTSSLVFFIALVEPGGPSASAHHALAALAGGLWGVALQVALWPIRPQHPVRKQVAESWLAAADLFAASAPPADPSGADARHAAITAAEAALRTSIDKATAATSSGRPSPLSRRFSELNFTASRLVQRVTALSSALESDGAAPAPAELEPALQPVFTAFVNLGRTVALAVVSRQPAHVAAAEVRLRRIANLLRGLRSRGFFVAADAGRGGRLGDSLRRIEDFLPEVGAALRSTVGRANERTALSLELFDLSALSLRPLAADLNLSRKVEPALIRFTARICALTMIGVAAIKFHVLPHGYWLPFTMVVVLQPDYGSTRQKAAQRMLGTLVGSILASALLWMRLPFAALMAATAATSFLFGYWLKRNYGLTVVFITLFVVLLTESGGTAQFPVTVERLGCTLAGGALALLAALWFWPAWERDRFPPLLATALRSSRAYLLAVSARLAAGGRPDGEAVKAKQEAERANRNAFSSIQRMYADPKNRQDRLESAAALTNGNQRLIRILNSLALHLVPGSRVVHPALGVFAERSAAALAALADSVERPAADPGALERARAALDGVSLPLAETAGSGPEHEIFSQLARAATELSAMLLLQASLSDGG